MINKTLYSSATLKSRFGSMGDLIQATSEKWGAGCSKFGMRLSWQAPHFHKENWSLLIGSHMSQKTCSFWALTCEMRGSTQGA